MTMKETYGGLGKTNRWDSVMAALRTTAREYGLVVLPHGKGGFRAFDRCGKFDTVFDDIGNVRNHLLHLKLNKVTNEVLTDSANCVGGGVKS